MRDFAERAYHTEYSCSGDYNKGRSVNACFASVFGACRAFDDYTIDYKVYLYQDDSMALKRDVNHYCLLDKRELRSHLSRLRGIIPFSYKIIEKEEHGCPCFIVNLHVSGKGIQHEYLLTWLRYSYEYPYNVFLKEALRLRKEKEFMFESISNLFNLVGVSFGMLYGGHSIGNGRKIGFLKRRELEEKIKLSGRLNDIYNAVEGLGNQLGTSSKIKKNLRIYDKEFWQDEELFMNERKPVYLEKLKKIKERLKK